MIPTSEVVPSVPWKRAMLMPTPWSSVSSWDSTGPSGVSQDFSACPPNVMSIRVRRIGPSASNAASEGIVAARWAKWKWE